MYNYVVLCVYKMEALDVFVCGQGPEGPAGNRGLQGIEGPMVSLFVNILYVI